MESEVNTNITIPFKKYKELLKAEKWKEALIAGGVDSWVFYEDSLADYGYFDYIESEKEFGDLD